MEKENQEEIGSGNNAETPGRATVPSVLTQLAAVSTLHVFLTDTQAQLPTLETQSTLKELPRPKGNEPKPSK